jgi:ATP-binding cassette, subfamily B, bacterial
MSAYYFEEEEFSTQINRNTIKRILSLTKSYWVWVISFLLFTLIVSYLDSYFTYLSKRIVDEGIVAGNLSTLKHIVVTYGILILMQSLAVFGFIYLAGVLGERVHYDLRKMLFNKLQELSLSYFSKTPVGWIMSRVTSDTERVSELVTWGLLDVTWAIANFFTAGYFMFRINSGLAAIVFSILPIIIWVAIQFRKRILKEYREARKLNSKITGAFNENVSGVRVVKALGREKENLTEFSRLTGDMYKASYRAAWLSALFLPSVQIISAFALGSIVWYGGWRAQIGGITIGGIQAFISYVTFMMWPIQDIARVYAEMQQSVASGERIFSLLDTTPEIMDKPGSSVTSSISGMIEFEHVDFQYEYDEEIIKDLNLRIFPGETIALVGPTGGGKSTIVNLLCRFYEPTKGVIRFDGHDYTDLNLYALQSKIGIVLQTPHLFSGTIQENIRYGKLDATEEDIIEAAQLAGAHEFIMEMDKYYDTEVGEGGNLLSTGQKQLVSIARAILSNPDLFILDEATSSVDTLTEAFIQKGLSNLLQNRTSIIIAHRLSTIKRADRIIVIKNGKIEEMGSHEELLKNKGHYYRLYARQFQYQTDQRLDGFSNRRERMN